MPSILIYVRNIDNKPELLELLEGTYNKNDGTFDI